MKPGDIVKIFAPIAGYKKYHFCISLPSNAETGRFLYLNSDPNFKDSLCLDCERAPCLPPSKTGYTAISFSMMPRYSIEKLSLFEAETIGGMPLEVIVEMKDFLVRVKSLPSGDKEFLGILLQVIIESISRSN